MWTRVVGVLFLVGVVCLGTTIADETASTLLGKGMEASKSGNYEEAERYDRLATDIAERTGDTTQLGKALSDLGGVLLVRGRYTESKQVCLKALSILRKTPAKASRIMVLNYLGVLSSHEGDIIQSERYLKESLRLTQELDPHDPYIARVLNNLGVAYYTTGDDSRAEKTFKKAIALIEKELGPDRAELAPILNNLGGVYLGWKKWDAAAPLFHRALSVLKNSGRPSDVASVLESLGTMHDARENVPEAEKAFRRAYEIRLDVFGARHPKVARTALNLASALTKEGHYDEAERLYTSALLIYETALGPRASAVAATLDEMAKLLRKINKEEAASELEARAASIRFELRNVFRVEQLSEQVLAFSER